MEKGFCHTPVRRYLRLPFPDGTNISEKSTKTPRLNKKTRCIIRELNQRKFIAFRCRERTLRENKGKEEGGGNYLNNILGAIVAAMGLGLTMFSLRGSPRTLSPRHWATTHYFLSWDALVSPSVIIFSFLRQLESDGPPNREAQFSYLFAGPKF